MVSAQGELELEFWKIREGVRECPWFLTQQPRTKEFPREERSIVLEVIEDEVLLDIVKKGHWRAW